MSNPFVVAGFFADQGLPQAWGKTYQATAKPSKLYYCVAMNKSASTVYIKLYDSASGASGEPRVLPCAAGSFVGWSSLHMRNGIYLAAHTSADGTSAIAGDDVKYDVGFTDQIV